MEREPRKFYGWLVVLSTFMANFMATGTGFYSFNAWLEPICRQNGWSRTEINIAPSLGVAVGLLTQVLYGRLIRKYGARPLMLIGAFCSGISFTLMGRTHQLGLFYLFSAFLFISNGAFHGIVPNTAVSYWFEKKRGKALGISIAGVSLSGVLIPPLALFLLKKYDLPTMFMVIGLMTWVLVISSAALFMKKRPEDYGMVVDGIKPEKPGTASQERETDMGRESPAPLTAGELETRLPPLAHFLRARAFWMVGLAYGLAMMPVVGVMIQLKPRFSDIGFSDDQAMAMMVLTALLGTVGKYGWGRLCDSFDGCKVVAVSFLFQVAGLAILLFARNTFWISIFIILFGFGMGGVVSTFPIVVAGFFGREHFPKVYGYIGLFLLLQSGGYLMMGQSFDLTHSYNYAYIGFIILDLVATILVLLGRGRKETENPRT